MKTTRTQSARSKKMGAVIYTRVSTREQVENLSLDSQERLCRRYCEEQGFKLLGVFCDEGKSARTTNRPQLQAMLEYCKNHSGSIDAVVQYRLDRIMRNNSEFFYLKGYLESLGIRLVYATQPNIDGSPEGELMEGMISSTSQYESRIIGKRARDGMREARRRGKMTNAPPIGYKWQRISDESGEIIPDPDRAAMVAEAFRLFAEGVLSPAEITRHINRMGFKSPRSGQPFRQQSLFRMLRNRRYAGYVFIDEAEGWVKGIHIPLVDDATFDRVQRRLDAGSAIQVPRVLDNPEFPLRGLVRCPLCNRHLTASFSTGRHGGRYGYYHCGGKACGGLNIRREKLEGAFLDLLDSIVPAPALAAQLKTKLLDVHRQRQSNVRSELRKVHQEISALENKLNRLNEAFIFERSIGKDVYESMKPGLQNRLDDLRLLRDDLSEENIEFEHLLDFAFSVLSNSRRMWEKASPEQRIALQRAIFPEGLVYTADEGYGTPVTSSGFSLLGLLNRPEEAMAVPRGIEPRFDG
jgi:site-specific DNA recombinase